LSAASRTAGPILNARGGKRPRRSWSDEEKRQIVEEAVRPGASVADIARRHGLNANQIFNWRKAARAPSLAAADVSSSVVRLQPGAPPSAVGPTEFIPIGVVDRAENDGPALAVRSSPAMVAGSSSSCATTPRPGMDERPGVIEIDLADGTRLRVDAFVNERALRRVLAVLKAPS
jgi:transposase